MLVAEEEVNLCAVFTGVSWWRGFPKRGQSFVAQSAVNCTLLPHLHEKRAFGPSFLMDELIFLVYDVYTVNVNTTHGFTQLR